MSTRCAPFGHSTSTSMGTSLCGHSPRAELAPKNRRQYSRHRVSLGVELRSSESGIPMRVSATDACGNGCYLQTTVTSCTSSQFTAIFCFADRRVVCECTVRTCDPGLGMGIEFTGLDPTTRLELQTWLEKHCSSLAADRKSTRL